MTNPRFPRRLAAAVAAGVLTGLVAGCGRQADTAAEAKPQQPNSMLQSQIDNDPRLTPEQKAQMKSQLHPEPAAKP